MAVRDAINAKQIRARVAEMTDGPVHQGTYLAQELNGTLYGGLPSGFANHYDIDQSTELEVFVDYELGCVLVFPTEELDNGE